MAAKFWDEIWGRMKPKPTACLWLAADADEGHLVVGAAAVHAAALELVVDRAELAEVA